MNIIVLDRDPKLAAQYHGDKMLFRAISETTLLANNALILRHPNYPNRLKVKSQNGHITQWVAQSRSNFNWVIGLGLALCEEYAIRFGKTHEYLRHLQKWNTTNDFRKAFDNIDMTPFVKCLPEQYQVEDAVQSYRQYYKGAKSHLAQWRGRSIPAWWNETVDLGKVKIVARTKKSPTSFALYARGWDRIFGRPALAQMEAAQVQMIVPKPPLHQPVLRFDEPQWDEPLLRWHDEDEVPF